ncbi:hypothetical protein COCVIDRAFT_20297 [Bipolaris victoriae FI3]|uniref:Uncharacterized protein n=1 Tax=Bipolaris victoriae (strain FI3) TaxID=930091 RepID=W7ECK2_BIPV3|nr:hypothetical protein COCVIDRAFT_20297 [Bipolaris victoriae FI3]
MLCRFYTGENTDNSDKGEHEGCEGDDCDPGDNWDQDGGSGGGGGGGGGCKIGLRCDICVGFHCIKLVPIVSAIKEPCVRLVKPKTATHVASTKPGTTCNSLHCPIRCGCDCGGEDAQEKERYENKKDEICIPDIYQSIANPAYRITQVRQVVYLMADAAEAASRGNLVFSAERSCEQYRGFVSKSSVHNTIELNFSWDELHKAGLNVLAYMVTKANCRGKLNRGEFNKQLLQIIDSCHHDTIADKLGSILTNNCLSWRIDPEINKTAGRHRHHLSDSHDGSHILIYLDLAFLRPRRAVNQGSISTPLQRLDRMAFLGGTRDTANTALPTTKLTTYAAWRLDGRAEVGTTKVVDDICHYITSIDHEDASDRDQVRELKYDKYASATCRRADKVTASGLTNHFLPVTCT